MTPEEFIELWPHVAIVSTSLCVLAGFAVAAIKEPSVTRPDDSIRPLIEGMTSSGHSIVVLNLKGEAPELQAFKSAVKRRKRVKSALPKQEPPRPRTGKRVQWLPGRLSFVREVQLDENCSNQLAARLRSHGVAVVTTKQGGLRKASDPRQLARARVTRRVLVTRDKGFLRMHSRGAVHAGIIHAPSGEQWNQEILRVVLRLFSETV